MKHQPVISKKINIRKKQIGISLLETLATILIVSFGVLGLAKLQISNLAYLNNSINSLKASFYAENLISQLEINIEQAKTTNSPYILTSFTDTPSSIAGSDLCISSSCNVANLAIHDMNIWLHQIKNNLPNGKAKVIKEDDGSTVIYTITVQWTYKSETNTYETYVQL